MLFAFLLASCGSSGFSSSGPTTTASSGSGSTNSSSSSSVSLTCPSSTVLSSMFGHAFPAPKITHPSSDPAALFCSYFDSVNTAVGLGITFYPNTSMSASTMNSGLKAESKSLSGATVITIPGLGNAAYKLTSNEGSGPTSTLLVLTGSTEISIVAEGSFAGNVVTLARYLLAH